MQLPAPTRRLFAHYALQKLEATPFLVARLLEEGDHHDLRWLCRRLGEEALGEWLRRAGGRQLSVRSRLLWEKLLDRQAGGSVAQARQLWPL